MASRRLKTGLRESIAEAFSNMDVSDSILLIVGDNVVFHDAILYAVKDMLSRDKYGIYVSLNKPHDAVKYALHKASIDTKRLFFVDCVSVLAHKTPTKHDSNVVYALGPHDLEDGASVPEGVKKFLNSIPGEKFILLDALRTLMIYNDSKVVVNFIRSLLSLTKSHDVKVVAITRHEDNDLLKRISKVFDEVATLH